MHPWFASDLDLSTHTLVLMELYQTVHLGGLHVIGGHGILSDNSTATYTAYGLHLPSAFLALLGT